VRRPDADELVALRNGSLSAGEFARFESVDGKTELVGGMLRREYDAFALAADGTALPDSPDRAQVEDLLVDLSLRAWREDGR